MAEAVNEVSSAVDSRPVPGDVARAIAFLRGNLHRSISVKELAATVGVGERTLRAHFRTFLGTSPNSYSVNLRLAAARRTLQRAEGDISVSSVAIRYGFSHLGRFSNLYRQAFGELPSATVASGRRGPLPTSPALQRGRPQLAILPIAAPSSLSNLAHAIVSKLAARTSEDFVVSISNRPDKVAGRYAIQGSLVQSGERLRVQIALIDVAQARHLWGESWDGTLKDPITLIERIGNTVGQFLEAIIRDAEIARVSRMNVIQLDSYELCLRAFPLLATTTDSNARKALDLLYRAIERDPDCALAPGLAAWGHAQLILQAGSVSPAADLEQARNFVTRACLLDPNDPIVLTARCMIQTIARDYQSATNSIDRSLAKNGQIPWAWERKGWLKLYSGDAGAAKFCFGRALRLNSSAGARATKLIGIGAAFFDLGDYQQSAKWMQHALNSEPSALWVNRSLAVCYQRLGEGQLATQALESLKRYRPDITVSDVVASLCFSPDFVARIANGLSDLGLAP